MIKLVVFDVDDTLTLGRSIWEQFYREIGTWEKIGQKYLDMFKRREITFDEFMKLDVGQFKGYPKDIIERAVENLEYIGGIGETVEGLRERGIKTAIVSGTIGQFAVILKEKHSIDFCFANPLKIGLDNCLTGEIEILVPPMRKDLTMRKLKETLGLKKEEVMAVGDSELDFPMFDEAGVSVCVETAPESVKKRVDHILPAKDLTHILKIIDSAKNFGHDECSFHHAQNMPQLP